MKKRLVALSLSLALLVSFCGCSGKKTSSEYTEYESVVDSTGLSDNSQAGGSKTESGSNGGTGSTGGGTTSVPKYTKPNKPSTSATDTSGHKVELANPVYIAEGTKAMDEGLNFGGKTFTMAKRSDENYTQGRFSRLVAAFEKKYNCKIKTSELEFNSYVTLVTNAKASGTPYDIIFGHGSMFPSLPMGGVLNDLSEYFTTADYDTGKGGVDIAKSSYFVMDGKLYGVVGGEDAVSPEVIYYNKVLFKKSGLEDPYELYKAGKWTWSKFREQGKKVTDSANKVYYGDADFFRLSTVHSLGMPIVTWKNNSAVLNLQETKVVKGFQLMYDLFNSSKICSPYFNSTRHSHFSDGLSYCTTEEMQKYPEVCGIAAQSPAFNRSADNVGIVPFPQDTASAKAGYPCGWYSAVMSGAGSSDPRVAIAFAKFWSTYNDPVSDKYELNSEYKQLRKKLISGNIINTHGSYTGSDGSNAISLLNYNIAMDIAKGQDVTSSINMYLPKIKADIDYVLSKKK